MELEYKQASTLTELEQILDLQGRNLPESLSQEELSREGFVTVRHNLKLLQEMNSHCGHIIAKDGDKVVGYALCMHPRFAEIIPVLRPMFAKITAILPKDLPYMVMGQICIDKDYRSKGVFRALYTCMKGILADDFDLIVTEVDTTNVRSVRAHEAVGFKELCRYTSGTQLWQVISLQTSSPGN